MLPIEQETKVGLTNKLFSHSALYWYILKLISNYKFEQVMPGTGPSSCSRTQRGDIYSTFASLLYQRGTCEMFQSIIYREAAPASYFRHHLLVDSTKRPFCGNSALVLHEWWTMLPNVQKYLKFPLFISTPPIFKTESRSPGHGHEWNIHLYFSLPGRPCLINCDIV
jgi:hypothetical protein